MNMTYFHTVNKWMEEEEKLSVYSLDTEFLDLSNQHLDGIAMCFAY